MLYELMLSECYSFSPWQEDGGQSGSGLWGVGWVRGHG